MKTFLAQNQFISNSASHVPVDAGSAAVNAQPPSTAAAEAISDDAIRGSLPSGESDPSVMLDYAPSGTAATDSCQEPVAADCIAETCENLKFVYECTDGTMFHRCATCGRKAYLNATNDIPEIFRVAHQLCAGARQFVPDHHAIWDAMHDPGSPRALESDLVWADEAPLFLRMAI